MKKIRCENGFSLMELLVSMVMFSVLGLGIMLHITQTYRRLALENHAALSAMELRSALEVLRTELRDSSYVSPYLPGNITAQSNCTNTVVVTATSIKFLVVNDDAGSPMGLRASYVGYEYNPATKELLRGEVASTALTSDTCAVPAQDPLNSAVESVIARDVERVDTNGDGTNEAAFSYTKPILTINLGVKAESPSHMEILQKVTTQISLRNAR